MTNSQLEAIRQYTQDECKKITVPYHIAFIMDGNGRWAQQRGLPRTAGHEAGVQKTRDIIEACGNLGIKIITLYAFSTENWRRPKREVLYLMRLFEKFAVTEIKALNRNNIRLQYLGQSDGLPLGVKKAMAMSSHLTANNTGLILNIALNYGGRAEITNAARAVIQDVHNGRLSPDAIDEDTFSQYLYTASLPDPDLIIRTGGEQRLSNFLLWQSSHSFFWVTDTRWPDMVMTDLEQAVTAWNRSLIPQNGLKYHNSFHTVKETT